MADFLLAYRNDYASVPQTKPEEAEAIMKKWMDWLGGIAAQGKLTDKGHPLKSGGKVVRANNKITDGPYTEIKESIMGYSIVTGASLEEATELANGCPILSFGGSVEIREINAM